jgi:hypothetical protein
VTFRIGSYTGGGVPGATILGRCCRGINPAVPTAESDPTGRCAKTGTALKTNNTPQIAAHFDTISSPISDAWDLHRSRPQHHMQDLDYGPLASLMLTGGRPSCKVLVPNFAGNSTFVSDAVQATDEIWSQCGDGPAARRPATPPQQNRVRWPTGDLACLSHDRSADDCVSLAGTPVRGRGDWLVMSRITGPTLPLSPGRSTSFSS